MKKMFAVIVLSILLLVPLGLSLTPKDVSSIVSLDITRDEVVVKNVNIPLEEINCKPDNKIVLHTLEGSRTLIFLSGDASGTSYSDVSSKQILDKIKELTGADIDKIKKIVPLQISGSLLEDRNWYVYENEFRVIEGNILSKNSPRLPNVNPPELIGKFKIEIPQTAEHKFDSKGCPNIVDPIPFNSLPEGQYYASSNDPENKNLLSSLTLNGETVSYFSSWNINKLEEDPNSVVFGIDNDSSLSVKALKDDPELSEQQETENFLSIYNESAQEEGELTESVNNSTKTSTYVSSVNGKLFGFAYTSSSDKFDIYKDMISFVENSLGVEQIQATEGPQLTLDILTQGCKNEVYSVNFKLEANHKEDITNLEYRIFIDSKKEDSKKIQVNAKRFSSEEIYSFNVSDHKNLEIFSIASANNNSVSYEKELINIDKNICDGQKPTAPPPQPTPTPQTDNNTLIFASVIAFLIGLGLMGLIKR